MFVVLTEFLTLRSRGEAMRRAAVELVRAVHRDPNTKVIPQTRDSLTRKGSARSSPTTTISSRTATSS